MGIKIPPDWPEIDDTKHYKINVDAFQGGGPPLTCAQDFAGNLTCCIPGLTLNGWIDGGNECTDGGEACLFSGFSAQRLKTISGPYDTPMECLAAI